MPTTLSRLVNFWRNLFRRERVEQDLDAEVRAHLELLTDENVRAGMSAAQARRAARIELGGIEQVKEEVRDVRAGAWLGSIWQDLRYGDRSEAGGLAQHARGVADVLH